jgi:hypothetical protein
VFEKVYNSAKQKAHADGKGKIFDRRRGDRDRVQQAQDKGGPAWAQAKHAVFDRLVYGKLRAALGGQVQYAVSGGAPLGERLGHFFRGIGVTGPRGLRPDRDHRRRVDREPPDALQDRHRRPAAAGHVTVRIADDGEILFKGGQVFPATGTTTRRPPTRSTRTAGSTPATWASSTTTASSRSPAARRRSWSPPAARTSRPPCSRTGSARTRWSASAWWSATASRSSPR